MSGRHIGERGAGLRGADRAVDQAMALEGGDDVAADLASRQPRNLPPRDRLQISDRGQRKGFGPGELGNVVPSPSGMGGADRRGEARFGAQRIAAGDKGEVVGAAAQLVDEVGDQIVEPAVLADQADQRLARDGFCEAKMAASTLSIHSRQRAAGGKSASSTSRPSSRLVGDGAPRRS